MTSNVHKIRPIINVKTLESERTAFLTWFNLSDYPYGTYYYVQYEAGVAPYKSVISITFRNFKNYIECMLGESVYTVWENNRTKVTIPYFYRHEAADEASLGLSVWESVVQFIMVGAYTHANTEVSYNKDVYTVLITPKDTIPRIHLTCADHDNTDNDHHLALDNRLATMYHLYKPAQPAQVVPFTKIKPIIDHQTEAEKEK